MDEDQLHPRASKAQSMAMSSRPSTSEIAWHPFRGYRQAYLHFATMEHLQQPQLLGQHLLVLLLVLGLLQATSATTISSLCELSSARRASQSKFVFPSSFEHRFFPHYFPLPRLYQSELSPSEAISHFFWSIVWVRYIGEA